MPTDIAVDVFHKVYVVTSSFTDNSISVIDGFTYKNLKNITVGNIPIAITVDPFVNKVYVARMTRTQGM